MITTFKAFRSKLKGSKFSIRQVSQLWKKYPHEITDNDLKKDRIEFLSKIILTKNVPIKRDVKNKTEKQLESISTASKDVLDIITSQMDTETLIKLCHTSKKFKSLCKDKDFWKNHLLSDFGVETGNLYKKQYIKKYKLQKIEHKIYDLVDERDNLGDRATLLVDTPSEKVDKYIEDEYIFDDDVVYDVQHINILNIYGTK